MQQAQHQDATAWVEHQPQEGIMQTIKMRCANSTTGYYLQTEHQDGTWLMWH